MISALGIHTSIFTSFTSFWLNTFQVKTEGITFLKDCILDSIQQEIEDIDKVLWAEEEAMQSTKEFVELTKSV